MDHADDRVPVGGVLNSSGNNIPKCWAGVDRLIENTPLLGFAFNLEPALTMHRGGCIWMSSSAEAATRTSTACRRAIVLF